MGPVSMNKALCWLCLCSILIACNPADPNRRSYDFDAIPALTERGFQVVVEIPAGTNKKLEYDHASKQFTAEIIDGQERSIRFLPYPGNYGFIPSTLMDATKGGDGDPLDVLLLSESLPTGTIVEAIPVGALQLRDRGEIDTKIIAVPLDSSRRVLSVADFQQLMLENDPARRIIEDWFLYYKGYGMIELLGWEDEQYAWEEIRRWQIDVH